MRSSHLRIRVKSKIQTRQYEFKSTDPDRFYYPLPSLPSTHNTLHIKTITPFISLFLIHKCREFAILHEFFSSLTFNFSLAKILNFISLYRENRHHYQWRKNSWNVILIAFISWPLLSHAKRFNFKFYFLIIHLFFSLCLFFSFFIFLLRFYLDLSDSVDKFCMLY